MSLSHHLCLMMASYIFQPSMATFMLLMQNLAMFCGQETWHRLSLMNYWLNFQPYAVRYHMYFQEWHQLSQNIQCLWEYMVLQFCFPLTDIRETSFGPPCLIHTLGQCSQCLALCIKGNDISTMISSWLFEAMVWYLKCICVFDNQNIKFVEWKHKSLIKYTICFPTILM